MAAITAGHVGVVEVLLEAGANVPPAALSMALASYDSRYPLRAMLVLLVRGGADPTGPALQRQAMWLSGPFAARTLAKVCRQGPQALGPWTELLQALVRGDERQALRLHEQLRATEASADQPSAVELLVQMGADIERRDGSFGTALHRACAAAHVEVGAYLIGAGADLEAPRGDGLPGPPLFACIDSGSLPLARLLLESGADPSSRDWQGRTAAEHARAFGREELAELLARHSE